MSMHSTLRWVTSHSERGIEIKGPLVTGHIALGLRTDKSGKTPPVEVLGLVEEGGHHVWIRNAKGLKNVISLHRAWEAYGQADAPAEPPKQPELPIQSAKSEDVRELLTQMSMEAQAERQLIADTMSTTRRKIADIETELRARNQLIDELTKTLQAVLLRLQPMKEVSDA